MTGYSIDVSEQIASRMPCNSRSLCGGNSFPVDFSSREAHRPAVFENASQAFGDVEMGYFAQHFAFPCLPLD